MDTRYFVCVKPVRDSDYIRFVTNTPIFMRWKCPNNSFSTIKEAEEWGSAQGKVYESRLYEKSFYMPYKLSVLHQVGKDVDFK